MEDKPYTLWLHQWRNGDLQAFERVLRAAMQALESAARQRLREHGDITLNAAELLDEAVIRLMDSEVRFGSRAHFLATASLHMRAVLVDHARARRAQKRGAGMEAVTLNTTRLNAVGSEDDSAFDLVALDEALTALEVQYPRTSQVLHLSCFTGLERAEIAQLLGVSLATVDRELRFGRAWLGEYLGVTLD
jgi:RNA polymerase sigma factor (TIGR02999 family)